MSLQRGPRDSIRGMDSNTLLRMHDEAKDARDASRLRQDRIRAAKVVQRIARELGKREVPL